MKPTVKRIFSTRVKGFIKNPNFSSSECHYTSTKPTKKTEQNSSTDQSVTNKNTDLHRRVCSASRAQEPCPRDELIRRRTKMEEEAARQERRDLREGTGETDALLRRRREAERKTTCDYIVESQQSATQTEPNFPVRFGLIMLD